MASTTSVKKEIIDFLWEWAEPRGDWAKLLTEKIVQTEASLSSTDRQLVFDYFIDSLRTIKMLPSIVTAKPAFAVTDKTVKLSSLSAITGVNRLAKNQTMSFGDNITIIYGENGTGKTGYGRILKSLGFSYDLQNTIHRNIYAAPEARSATIAFEENGMPQTFNWDGKNTNGALSNISVFNNNCVQISLADRKLIVSPIGFHLFNIVTAELGELSSLLNQKKTSYPTALLCAAALHEGTVQQLFINSLSEKSTELKLKELSDFTGDIDKAIAQKEKDLVGLNQELINTQIRDFTSQINELDALVVKIKANQALLTLTQWNELIDLNQTIKGLEKKTKLGLKDIAEAHGIGFYETPEFKNFLESAESYIELLNKPYPETGDVCVYCNQPLDDTAQKLLQAYKAVLNDTTENDLKKSRQTRDEMVAKASRVETKLVVTRPSFGADAGGNAVQPPELTAFNKRSETLKEHFVKNTLTKEVLFDIDYAAITRLCENKATVLNADRAAKTATLNTIADQVKSLTAVINELKDRKLLTDNFTAIKTAITNRKSLALLNSKANEFGTHAISRKTTEAREELLSQNFDKMFKEELVTLRKDHLKIDLSFGTDKGTSKISQKIKQYLLTDILSEGEQKAIALSEFLTELHLDNSKAPVVFDDPVNSLDHTIIDEVVKRLIKLSTTRQVIIFTHSILFLNSCIQQAELDIHKQAGTCFTFYSVKNNFDDTGVLGDVEEINSYNYYIKKLKKVLDGSDKTTSEEKLAADGYAHLRAAIEVCVEEEILQKTIKRYRKGVAFPSLLRIKGGAIDDIKGDLNDIYEKCCVSIIAHSSPPELHTAPTINSLRSDFDRFTKIRSNFTG